jgi:hypothetical protein
MKVARICWSRHQSAVDPEPVQHGFLDDDHGDDQADPSLHSALQLRAAPQQVRNIAGPDLMPRHLPAQRRRKGRHQPNRSA